MIVPHGLLLLFGAVDGSRRTALTYWQGMAWIVGLDVLVSGDICLESPVLFVSNHISYLDIVVLGALVKAGFIAKKEVASWPGINVIAKLGRTVFVDRRPRKSLTQRDEIQTRLTADKESLILFPEGTSSDGNRVLPFKSALFSVAELIESGGKPLAVQPISIAYTHLDGLPIGRTFRPLFAWYGDMDLVSHLWMVLGLGRTTIEVEFHPAVRMDGFPTRRALADHCRQVIAGAVIGANSGRIHQVLEPA